LTSDGACLSTQKYYYCAGRDQGRAPREIGLAAIRLDPDDSRCHDALALSSSARADFD